MKDAQKPNHINLNSLISKLKEGRYVIPDFQREFKWDPSDVRDLMRSIFLDYYIGTLLLWKGKKENFELLDCEHLYGHTGDHDPDYIVLDGQQRLTAMYYAFHAPNKPLPYRKMRFFYFIRVDRFVAEEYDEAFDYIWVSDRWQLLDNVDAQFMQHIFPLAVVGKGIWEIADWIDGYKKYWEERKSNAEKSESTHDMEVANIAINNSQEFRKELADVTQEFQISFIELERKLEIEKICDIFTQINSRGIKLDTFDLMNALLKPKNIPLKQIWREAQKHLNLLTRNK